MEVFAISTRLNLLNEPYVSSAIGPNIFRKGLRNSETTSFYLYGIFCTLPTGTTPDDYMVANAVPVHKTREKQLAKNYRFISLAIAAKY